MIGNDIIDLRAARRESNWQRKGYLDKIYTPREQQMIGDAPCPERMVWLLWSMKESAYKIYNRETGLRFYAPLKLQCTYLEVRNNEASGIVEIGNNEYDTTSSIHPDHIHTIALRRKMSGPHAKIMIRHNDGMSFTAQSSFLTNGYYLYKNKYGLPYVMDSISGQQRFASLSHHGQFTALVIGAGM